MTPEKNPMRRRFAPIVLLTIASLCISMLPGAAIGSGQEEVVAFNTKSLKYHCLSCEWAVKCTRNCIEIPRSEAIRRGGVPCKVCGGSCTTQH